ncbi:putative inorganic phosphate cotransporter [Diorhabda sublineata]|uniref:putative inorganic phosphate cotransporter n=1 Tax=Diorhabda sublineata TaxID=1163346 RepID=UPI0024E0ED3C|nr:putative inorganic phosphate cotransporter [Diorhabda sublineata]
METKKIKGTKPFFQKREILWYFVFSGFAVNYMIRINLNLAVVSMVAPKSKNKASITSECLSGNIPNNNSYINGYQENSTFTNRHVPLNKTFPELEITSIPDQYFDWNEKELGAILGSFFWLHWITQIPGGILAAKYGTKLIFGLSNFIGVFANFVIPWFAHKGALYLIFIRSIQGLCAGFCWPSMHHMVSKWIPPNERSKFITSYLGSSIGAALTYLLCGFIIERWGWEQVFYSCGVLGTIWFIAWWFSVYDSPAQHPSISQEEKDYISSSLGKTVSKVNIPTPWKSILTNIPLWATVVAQIGACWGFFTLMVNGPTYIKFIHGWDVRLTGLLCGMPHLFRVVFAYIFSLLGDYLLRTEKMKRSHVRKFATLWANGIQAVFMLGLAYSGCDKMTAVAMLTLAVTVNGAVSTGALAGLVDISPNHSAILLGISNTAVALVGFCTPAVIGYFTFQNQTAVQWQKVFWVCAGILLASCAFYTIFGNSTVASWNSPKENSDGPETEMMVTNEKNKKTNEEAEGNTIMYSNEEVY